MTSIRVITDLEEGQRVWEQLMPGEHISDLWDVRMSFQRQYNRPVHFIVAETAGRISGFLPLSRIPEKRLYGYFPGEVWDGKTWLEQNRIFADNPFIFDAMLAFLRSHRGRYHLRYLLPSSATPAREETVDEIGYLFMPAQFDYDMENYFRLFSHKSAKRIRREVAAIEGNGIRYRFDDSSDFDLMIQMNRERYGEFSYFNDSRFTESFRDLMHLLIDRGWFRMTAIEIEGEPAAVDLGSVYSGEYTLLAGGTNGRFPGIAKVINLHHMRRACEERMDRVDFLCGNFSWKTMFHLSPRPLYVLSNLTPPVTEPARPSVLRTTAVPDTAVAVRGVNA